MPAGASASTSWRTGRSGPVAEIAPEVVLGHLGVEGGLVSGAVAARHRPSLRPDRAVDRSGGRDGPVCGWRTMDAMQKRWNGWGDETVTMPVPGGATALLGRLVGPRSGRRTRPWRTSWPPCPDVADRAGRRSSASDPEDRVRHARGQSLGDWVALRSGRLGLVPDAVARPATSRPTSAPSSRWPRSAAGGWCRTAAARASSAGSGRPSWASCAAAIRRSSSWTSSGWPSLRGLDEASGLATLRCRGDRAGPRVGAPGPRPDARPRAAVLGVLDARRLGRDALVRPALARLRADRGALRRRPARVAGRARWSCRRTRPRPPVPTCASSSWARRAGSGS